MECDEIKVELVYPEVTSPQEEEEEEEEEEQEEEQEEEAGEEQEELSVAFAKYRHFEEFMFGERLSASDHHVLLADFVREWEDRLAAAMAAGCAFSDTVLAFKGRCHEFLAFSVFLCAVPGYTFITLSLTAVIYFFYLHRFLFILRSGSDK
jgi:hypothetical protein